MMTVIRAKGFSIEKPKVFELWRGKTVAENRVRTMAMNNDYEPFVIKFLSQDYFKCLRDLI